VLSEIAEIIIDEFDVVEPGQPFLRCFDRIMVGVKSDDLNF
jgi:hypothetical protein